MTDCLCFCVPLSLSISLSLSPSLSLDLPTSLTFFLTGCERMLFRWNCMQHEVPLANIQE